MEKDRMSETRNAEWIASVEERLRWFLEEATDEEFDAEEVDTLVNLLNRLKPLESVEMQSDEEALAKFHEYARLREAGERANFTVTEEEGAQEGAVSKKQKSHNRLRHFVKNHKLVSAAAAILLVILVAGGSMGAVNANRGNGFFYWLQRDDEGMTMWTAPESMDEKKEVEWEETYSSLNEVPEEFQNYVIDENEIIQLQDYELKNVTIVRANTYFRIKQRFSEKTEEKNVYIGTLIYEDSVRLAREIHLSKEVQTIEGEESIEERMLLRENVPGMKEVKIFFYKDNVKYFVEGDMELEILIQIAEAYRDIVFK